MNDHLKDPFVIKPVLTVDGKPWTQRCYVCLKPVNFIKDPSANTWLRVPPYVRHRKCYPPPAK
jgi:hypothetical protein